MTKYEPIAFDIETTGLNPMAETWQSGIQQDAEVICVGIGTMSNWRTANSEEELEMDVNVIGDGNEYKTIQEVKEEAQTVVAGWTGDEPVHPFIVGWNNRKFDHPYYCARASRLRLDPWPFGHTHERLDCFKAVHKETGRYWKQDDWLDHIGYEMDDSIEGSDVPDLYDEGRLDIIRKHCYSDIEDLLRIFWEDREIMMDHYADHYGRGTARLSSDTVDSL